MLQHVVEAPSFLGGEGNALLLIRARAAYTC